jgi:hypothetical protein
MRANRWSQLAQIARYGKQDVLQRGGVMDLSILDLDEFEDALIAVLKGETARAP